MIDHGRTIAVGTADELKRQVGGERIELTLARGSDLDAAAAALAPHVDGSVRIEAESPAAVGGRGQRRAAARRRRARLRRRRDRHRRSRGAPADARRRVPDADRPRAPRRRPRPHERGALSSECGSDAERRHGWLYWQVSDAIVLTERALRHIPRNPELLIFSTIQPVMFVLLFRYVFGGAIRLPPGVSYVNYLMAGVFVQTVAFGSFTTGVGLAQDLQTRPDRPLPLAADVAGGGAARAHAVGPRAQHLHGRRDVRRRPAGRLQPAGRRGWRSPARSACCC